MQQYKVAVLGAAGGIGQPLSLLLKDNDNITHLSLYDLMNTPGVAADLSHIPSKAKVRCKSAARWASERFTAGVTLHSPKDSVQFVISYTSIRRILTIRACLLSSLSENSPRR